jgi:predicted Zn finger-like uncharacterized protein
MSLITRCPSCGTMFKVVSDQLKVSQGWVRCGKCAEVFDAQLHLQSEVALPSEQTRLVSAALDTSTVAPGDEQSTPAPPQPDLVAPLPAAVVATVTPVAIADKPLAMGPVEQESFVVIDQGTTAVLDSSDRDAFDDVPFVRDARRQAFWRRPLLRVALAIAALVLACVLGLQLAVHQHDALLAFEPRFKPWLLQICRQFDCDIGASRRIDAIVIDNSSFNKADGVGSYRLSFSLKNTGSSTVAMPALEVSLTDTQDRTVIRRVMSPAQFGSAGGLLAAGSEFSNTLTLQVQPETPNLRVAGYRLLAFYP